LLELGITLFQIVPHLVRLDLLLAEDLAHRALDQVGERLVPCRWCILAGMACQQPRRPQLVRIAVVFGFVAGQRHQPSFGLRRNRRLLPRSRPIIKGRQRAICQRPLDAALDGLMMHANSSTCCKERGILSVREKHLRPLHPTRRLGSGARNSSQFFNFLVGHRQFERLPPSCHYPAPRLINQKRGIHERIYGSMSAGFMESIV
jgi:hypothetical protein